MWCLAELCYIKKVLFFIPDLGPFSVEFTCSLHDPNMFCTTVLNKKQQ